MAPQTDAESLQTQFNKLLVETLTRQDKQIEQINQSLAGLAQNVLGTIKALEQLTNILLPKVGNEPTN